MHIFGMETTKPKKKNLHACHYLANHWSIEANIEIYNLKTWNINICSYLIFMNIHSLNHWSNWRWKSMNDDEELKIDWNLEMESWNRWKLGVGDEELNDDEEKSWLSSMIASRVAGSFVTWGVENLESRSFFCYVRLRTPSDSPGVSSGRAGSRFWAGSNSRFLPGPGSK